MKGGEEIPKIKLNVHMDILRDARLRVNALCGRAKSKYYTGKIEDCATDQKAPFRFTNGLMHQQRVSRLPSLEDPAVFANDFAQFFVE